MGPIRPGRRVRGIAIGLLLVLAATRPLDALELVVTGPPALRSSAERLQGLDLARLEAELGRAGLPVPAVARIELVPEADPRARATPRWVVGQAYPSGEIRVYPARASSYPYNSLEAVVWHELVHLSLFAAADGRNLPRWFHEGVAVSIETGWGVTDSLHLLLAAGRGPAIADISRLFGSSERSQSAEAYRLATALVDSLRSAHGDAFPGAVARRVAAGDSFERAFVLETGQTPEAAAREAWATYQTFARWLPVATSVQAVWTFILVLASAAFVIRLRRRRAKRWADDDPIAP